MPATTRPNAAPNTGSTEDALGYDAYAKTLWARIEQGLNRDTITGKLGDDPLVVGIFGEWGAGKSFLLGRILRHAFAFEQGRIDLRKGDLTGGNAGFGLTVPVLFQPWKYEHEEHLHVPLLLHILEALKRDLAASKSIVERAKTSIDGGGDWLVQQMKPAVALFEKLVTGAAVATVPITVGGSLVAIPAMGVVKWLLSKLRSSKPTKASITSTIRYTNEGRYFYEIHQHLKAVTRPSAGKNHDAGYTQGQQSKHEKLAINFVVFVDDLDRCLPEKAVAVLELIKTVFNVESFAFVLALDDEVIERGIGYRYKDYALGNKKSEMPITGFEYLEKIVHLPFRLPALTYADALRFLQRKEQALVKLKAPTDVAATRWFSPLPTSVDARRGIELTEVSATEGIAPTQRKIELNLAQLVLAAFDGYVPRKLDRVVELFHQVVSIAAERGRPLGVALGDDADPRVVLALVLLQLFQPELYRCLKRTGNGFDVLRDSMKENTLSPVFSDQDLLHWACYGIRPPLVRDAEARSGAADAPPIDIAETLRRIAKLGDSERYPAQRIRLPIVERMLEHRAAQRHVFDPLKLFAELNKSFADVPLAAADTRSYYSLLTLERVLGGTEALLQLTRTYTVEVPQTMTDLAAAGVTGEKLAVTLSDPPPPAAGNVVVLTDVRSVYAALISAEASDQTDVANRAGLKAGDVLASSSVALLLMMVDLWINNPPGSTTAAALKQQLLRGLLHLAPHLGKEEAQRFWARVNDCVTLPTEPNTLLDEPKVASLYADVRAALGFDPVRPYLMRSRFANHTEDDEPIPGFVRVPAGSFSLGHEQEPDSQARAAKIRSPFYVCRTLVTVEQFQLFVGPDGYRADDPIWVGQGLDWLRGKPDPTGTPLRSSGRYPENWIAQQRFRTRPVVGITWFEARAYARWLSLRLRAELDALESGALQVMLPTELQWERAACAADLTHARGDRWPWEGSGNDAEIEKRLNYNIFNLLELSAVGIFAPNPIGLYDMAGNAKEFMDNRFEPIVDNGFVRIKQDEYLSLADGPTSDSLSLRGGSWVSSLERCTCSYRERVNPGFSFPDAGFRVVLSQVE
jgi:formylglycine-generating enzyme required for sulfatase activity